MKKLLLSSLFAIFCMFQAQLQTVIFSDDFETYSVGDKLAQTSSLTEWTTWSGATGGTEDPAISNTWAVSGSNSVKIIPNNDLVLDLGDKTTGRYQIEFKILISTAKIGYFNLLNDFAGANSIWAFQAYFKAAGAGSVDAGGAESATFSYTAGQWNSVNLIVDLDDDFATFYFNGTEVVSWVFSKGTFGAGTLHKLDAVNFYGEAGSEFFIDDVVVTEQLSMTGPLNLQATLNVEDIDLTWNSPAGATPDSYVIVANNAVIATNVLDTFYTYLNAYPGDYDFTVKAHYNGLGYSQQSNIAEITIAGGVVRNYVLLEEGTGTWCPYCPGAAMGLEQMYDENLDIAVIAYHEGDPYETTQSLSRLGYYGITTYPSVLFDGGNIISGGSNTVSMYSSYKPVFDEKILIPSLYSMTMDVYQTSSTTYTATIDITQYNDYFTGPFKLYGAVTESSILVNWQGQNHLDFVFREMFPSTSGVSVDFSTDTTYNGMITFELDTSWVRNNCSFVVFLQHPSTKKVLQTAIIDMATISDVSQFGLPSVVVRPNPASEFVSIYADQLEEITIMSLTGQTVLVQKANQDEMHLPVDHLPSGIYMISIKSAGNYTIRKLVIQ